MLARAFCGVLILTLSLPLDAADTVVRVMTFNAWGGGANDGSGPTATLGALQAAGADLIGLQEARAEASVCDAGNCPAAGDSFAAVAGEALGYEVFEPAAESLLNWSNATLARYPVLATSPHGLGARFEIDGKRVVLFNVHFDDFPYQPYQASGIPYGDAPLLSDADDLVSAARKARGAALAFLREDLEFAEGADLTVITGDFNEPSHRDWTEAAAQAGRHPLAVDYPTVAALEALGFVDAYRSAHPDEISNPGFTWTPGAAPDAPDEHHDRIDFILVRGEGVRIRDALIVGESPVNADIVVQPWPSDHRAVVADIALPND